jgi:hypothetical protein
MLEAEIPAKDGRHFSIQQRHKGDIGRLAKNVSSGLIRSKNSSLTYVSLNGYPPDTEVFDAEILSRGLNALCAIIAKHGVQQFVGLVRLHQHFTIPDGHIQLGKRIRQWCAHAFWTQPTLIDEVDFEIHPYIFSLDGKGQLVPSEFREGPPGNIGKFTTEFVKEIVETIRILGLEKKIGLVLREAPAGTMTEFPFRTGCVLVEDKDVRKEVRDRAVVQVTQWAVVVTDGNVSIQPDQDCMASDDGIHYVPPPREVRDSSDALKVLQKEGILLDR